MANDLFSFNSFDFSGIQGRYSSLLEDYDKHEGVLNDVGKQDQMFSIEDLGANNSLLTGFDYQEDDIARKGFHLVEDQHQLLHHHQQHQQQTRPNDLMLNEFQPEIVFPPTQSCNHELPKLKNIQTSGEVQLQKPFNEKQAHPFALSSLELLSNYASGYKKLKGNLSYSNTGKEINEKVHNKLSTEEIVRVAGTRYVHFSDQSYDDFSMVMHPFGLALSGLSEEETRDVELVHLLLAAAEKVGHQQFERASRLLSRCEWIAAEKSNPVQRIVNYFAEALRERIDKETGNNITSKEESARKLISFSSNGLGTNPVHISCYQRLPFNQVLEFAGIQAILENTTTANKVHLIDFEIRSGVHWPPLMQALAEREKRPIQLLKITAVGLIRNKSDIEVTGRRLSSFAESLNVPLQFKVVCVSNYSEIKEDLLQIEKDDSVVVYCSLIFRIMISRPSCLENLIGVIKKLNPTIMVVIEIEANHNSPSFVNRFIEALFFYSAYVDCLEACMDGYGETKILTEAFFNHGIRDTVAMEGVERTVRSVKIEVWREFFSRFRMVEIGFSDSCLYQAHLVLKQFPTCVNSCTLDKNGMSLIIGWKGTPINSLSLWKFSRERGRSFLHYRF